MYPQEKKFGKKVFFFTISRCPKKIVKDCIFASFQGDLACSWSEKNARNSFSTYLASTLHFGLHGVLFEFVYINYAIFF